MYCCVIIIPSAVVSRENLLLLLPQQIFIAPRNDIAALGEPDT